jgi:hypothetical protein
VAVPDGVYLEPLIVVKHSEKRVDIEFITGGQILYVGEADECNPGMEGLSPLALSWRGVTHPKVGCKSVELTSARGFLGSWCDAELGSATVCWNEPPKDEVTRRVSSFFFLKTSWGSVHETSGTIDSVLVGATVVHDQDGPPEG